MHRFKLVNACMSADESKSCQRPLLSPASSVTSGISIKSLPASIPSLTKEERKKLNEEAYMAWKKNKAKQEIERKEKLKEEQERLEREKKEREEKQKKIEAENRARWLQKKQALTEARIQMKLEAQKKLKQEQEDKRQFSKEMVATWMDVARKRSRPVKGGVFESPRIKYINPIPWNRVLDE